MSHSDDSNRVRGSSVAAFLFMPQFRLCFQGFSHLWPVFMRCLAMVFSEAKLISSNHPALRYGEEDVEKVGIGGLLGSAWFRLRVTRADTYQWGMFTGIVLMLGMLVTTLGIFFARVFFGVGTAFAQYYLPNVFNHPCNVYGGGAGCAPGNAYPTGIDRTAAIPAPGAVLFDMRVSETGGTNISADYALMVLDKILRQSMTGPVGSNNGGILQNALADLMGMYNTGMTLIAGIITLWMVTAMVINTAKSGVYGGGRTNMIWVPMRMVFALGIIFPLGAQGYSAGQYMVMKLAEWGSNLASRGWVAYVQGVAANDSMLAPFSVNNTTSMVGNLNKILVCQVMYNAALLNGSANLDTRQVIRVKQDNSAMVDNVTNYYTNDTESNLCGSISYVRNKGAGTDENQMIMAMAGRTTPMDTYAASQAMLASRNLNTNYDNAMAAAVRDFRMAMATPLDALLFETMDEVGAPAGQFYGRGTASGSVVTLGRQLACQIAASVFEMKKFQGPNPVTQMGTVAGGVYDSCGGVAIANPVVLPDATIPQRQVMRAMDAVMCQYDGSAPQEPGGPACTVPAANRGRNIMLAYVGGGLIADLQKRGWAGMGRFYLDVAALNSQVQGARAPMVTVEPGVIWEGAGKSGILAGVRCAGRKMINQPCRMPEMDEMVAAALGTYDKWWSEASLPGKPAVNPTNTNPTEYRNQDLRPAALGQSAGLFDMVWSIVMGGTTKILETICWLILPRGSDDLFFFQAIDLAATNTYPLAQLTSAGHSIMNWGLIVIAGMTIAQVLWGIKYGAWLASVSGGAGLAVSLVANLLKTISMAMVLSGMMIAFYLPIIPLMRVAMAVLTWMFSIFEAIIMVPIAAIAHLSMEGQGLAGGARSVWILWLNVLLRPILVVFGFVGAMLIFNAFAAYFHTVFSQGAHAVLASSIDPVYVFLGRVAYSVMYLGTLYTAANICFKLLDILPMRLMRWLGGSQDKSLDDNSDGKMLAAASFMRDIAKTDMTPGGAPKKQPGSPNGKPGVQNAPAKA